MFPYPSGDGLHTGHVRIYMGAEILSRYFRMKGYAVLHPMGWDAFGLPAENAAMKKKTNPMDIVPKNIANFKRQMNMVGFSYDWNKELNTTDPTYYHRTQWLFLQFFKAGLLYKKMTPVHFCPHCKTGIAEEEVLPNGTHERCGKPIVHKQLPQWMFKITAYADRLLEDLEGLDWPEGILDMQRNWIGKSEGAEVIWELATSDYKASIQTFTTRPDTIFGVTAVVLAPEHPIVQAIVDNTIPVARNHKQNVIQYVEETARKSDIQRTDLEKDKTGVNTGLHALHPITKEHIPVWVADYVLGNYGHGAVMVVPAHDERDFVFAQKYGFAIKPVVRPVTTINDNAYSPTKTKALKNALIELLTLARDEGKQLFVWGGWAAAIHNGEIYRDHHDIDINVWHKDLAWWKEQLVQLGYTLHQYPDEEKIHPKNACIAKREEVTIDLGSQELRSDNYVTLLDGEEPSTSPWPFDEYFEQTTYEGLPVYALKKDKVKWALRTPEGKTQQRWQDMYDLLMLGQQAFIREGIAMHSAHGDCSLDGLETTDAKHRITNYLETRNQGKKKTTYKLRDWIFSRQRYWGEPIPMVYCEACAKKNITWWDIEGKNHAPPLLPVEHKAELAGWFPIDEKELPLTLPYITQYEPTGDGTSPLSQIESFVEATCPHCGGKAIRETDTMPNWAGSCWYFLQYPHQDNAQSHIDKEDSVQTIMHQLEEELKDTSRGYTIDCIIMNEKGQVFAQKRSATRRLFPGKWELPGGHVESGESVQSCIAKELHEELGIREFDVVGYIGYEDWHVPTESRKEYDQYNKRTHTVVIKTSDAVTITEPDKVDTWDWFDESNINTLNETKDGGTTFAYRSVRRALAYIQGQKETAALPYQMSSSWGPVDWYVGGAEHAVLHLLYARFWVKAMYDLGIVNMQEPFLRLRNVGMVLAEDHRKMSKSLGNVVNPDDVVAEYGADTLRLYELFMAPFNQEIAWDTKALPGLYRFLNRVWQAYTNPARIATDEIKCQSDLAHMVAKTIDKVTQDIEEFKFNTAIASMMECLNAWDAQGGQTMHLRHAKSYLQILAPFAPFITEELWHTVCKETSSIHVSSWPTVTAEELQEESLKIPVQVNGKVRTTIIVPADKADEDHILQAALQEERIAKYTRGKEYNVVYVKAKILNIVLK